MIKKSDKVICIDDYASFNRLKKGAKYTVSEAYDKSLTVIVNGSYHSLERFQEVPA